MTSVTTLYVASGAGNQVRTKARAQTQRKTMATCVWTIVLLLCAEGSLRVRAWYRHGSSSPVASIYEPDALLGRRLRPGATLAGSRRRLSVNRWGFRGPEIEKDKAAGTTRIAVVGDSTTFGLEAETNEAVWVERMVDRLNADAKNTQRFDAINAGVPGYTMDISALHFSRDVAPLSPDIVIINLLAADIAAHGRRQFPIKTLTQSGGSRVTKFFHTHSLLLNLVRQNTSAFRSRQLARARHDRLDDRGIEEYARRLADLIDVCRNTGAQALLCTCPRSFDHGEALGDQYALAATALANNPALSLTGLNDAFDRYNEVIRRIADEKAVPLIDLDRLIARGSDYFVDAIHLNDRGHRLVGEIVAEAVRVFRHAWVDGFFRAATVTERSRAPRLSPIVRSLTVAALSSPTHRMTCDATLEYFPFSYTGSTTLRNTSNNGKPRGLKPAARKTKTGDAQVETSRRRVAGGTP